MQFLASTTEHRPNILLLYIESIAALHQRQLCAAPDPDIRCMIETCQALPLMTGTLSQKETLCIMPRHLLDSRRQHKNHRQGHYASCSPAHNPMSPTYGQFAHDTSRLSNKHHDDHDRH